jgi:hypothetical protein
MEVRLRDAGRLGTRACNGGANTRGKLGIDPRMDPLVDFQQIETSDATPAAAWAFRFQGDSRE